MSRYWRVNSGGTWTNVDEIADHVRLNAAVGTGGALTGPSVAVTGAAAAGTTVAATTTVTAGTTITAGTGITSTAGNITASSGNVVGGTGVTATTGNIVATAGAIQAHTTVTAGSNLTAIGSVNAATGTIGGVALPAGLIKRIITTVDASADHATPGNATTVAVGTVPLGSILVGVLAEVLVPFDGDATQTFEVGVAGNIDNYIDTVDFDPSAAAGTHAFSLGGTTNDQTVMEYAVAAIDLVATWVNTASPSAGSVRVTALYI